MQSFSFVPLLRDWLLANAAFRVLLYCTVDSAICDVPGNYCRSVSLLPLTCIYPNCEFSHLSCCMLVSFIQLESTQTSTTPLYLYYYCCCLSS